MTAARLGKLPTTAEVGLDQPGRTDSDRIARLEGRARRARRYPDRKEGHLRRTTSGAKSMTEERTGLRSREWFGGDDLNGVIHRGWMRSEGLSGAMFDGRPVIGVIDSWSEAANCNAHLRGLAEAVKRGVLRAGGLPLEVPAMSLSEPLMKPTTMLYRN